MDGGDPLNPVTREIAVTVSPLMTFIEAMRQVERKYQNALGLSDDTEVITFAHSAAVDCYIINSIADVAHDDQSGWQVTITDRDNQVIPTFPSIVHCAGCPANDSLVSKLITRKLRLTEEGNKWYVYFKSRKNPIQ